MIHLTSWPVVIVEYGLAVFCFLDVVLMREAQVRWVPRVVWALLLLCFPVAGSIGWIVAGRPWRHHKLIPDDLQPDEPTKPGDPFHDATRQPGQDAEDAEDDHPGPGSPRARFRPPSGRPPSTPPFTPPATPRDQPAPDQPTGGQRPAHDDHPGHSPDRWRWHGRPHRRQGHLGGTGSGSDVPGLGPDGVGLPQAGSGPPSPIAGRGTPTAGIPLPRPDLVAAANGQDPETGLISELFAVHEEHERTLRRWEEDLLRREEALRRQQAANDAEHRGDTDQHNDTEQQERR
jgi:hypothetical protein